MDRDLMFYAESTTKGHIRVKQNVLLPSVKLPFTVHSTRFVPERKKENLIFDGIRIEKFRIYNPSTTNKTGEKAKPDLFLTTHRPYLHCCFIPAHVFMYVGPTCIRVKRPQCNFSI